MYCWLAMVVGLCFQGVGFRNEFGGGYSVIVYVIVHLCKFGAQQPHICWTSRVWQGRQKKRHDNWKIWRKNRDPKISEGYEHESKPITTQYDVVKLVLYDHQTSGRWGLHRNPHATASYNPFPGFFGGMSRVGVEKIWTGDGIIQKTHQPSSTIWDVFHCSFNIYITLKRSPKLRTASAGRRHGHRWLYRFQPATAPLKTLNLDVELKRMQNGRTNGKAGTTWFSRCGDLWPN